MKKQVMNTLFKNPPRVCNPWRVSSFFIIYFLIFNFNTPSSLIAQNAEINTQNIQLIIEPIYGNNKLAINGAYLPLLKSDSIQITLLKFYIAHIELLNNKAVIWSEPNSVHLINTDELNTLELPLNIPTSLKFNSIKFHLGIDSLTNNGGALGGDLDPTKGMYWSWQSGYVNFKLEGKSNVCPTRKHEFQFHLGGYLFPNNCLQTIELQVNKLNYNKLIVQLNIEELLSKIDLKQQNSVMIPSEEAVLLAQKVAGLFKIK